MEISADTRLAVVETKVDTIGADVKEAKADIKLVKDRVSTNEVKVARIDAKLGVGNWIAAATLVAILGGIASILFRH